MDERSIFLDALEKPSPGERAAYLDAACGHDPALRGRVEALLRAHDDAGSFLEKPPLAVAVAEFPGAGSTDDGFRTDPGPDQPAFTPQTDVPLDFLGPPAIAGQLGTLGPYQILDVVGQGGMGIVLKGHDPRLNRVVAVKVLLPELASNPAARKRFLREAQAAAAVSHDHVVTIHAIDEARGAPYLVMEFVAGISLQEKIDRDGPLGVGEILRIGMQTASGLAAAHAQGLIHRDIKPANILLENGIQRVKITDFGLARAVDDVSMTRTGVVAGTPQYMSPEQARGEYVDHRTDLFSLGSVVYALCTGRPPFRAESTIAVLRRVCDEPPRPIPQVNPDIPAWLADLIDRLLAKNPDERPRSAADVANTLGRHLAQLQHPAGAVAPTPPRRPARRDALRRRPAAVAAAALCLLAGLGLTEATGITQFVPSVIRVVTGEGTLVVEVNDPSVNLTIDGESLVITGAGPNEIRLRPGSYRVHADRKGQPLHDELVTVTRGGKQTVSIRVEPAAGAAVSSQRRFMQLLEQFAANPPDSDTARRLSQEMTDIAEHTPAVRERLRAILNDFGALPQDGASAAALVVALERVTARLGEEPVKRKLRMDQLQEETDSVTARPEPAGPPETMITFDVESRPETITSDGVEVDGAERAWKITSDQPRTVRMFQVGNPEVENAMLTYRAKLRTEDVRGKAYLEMWVRLPGGGEYFSKGLPFALTGTNNWSTYEIPFLLTAGQKPDLVRLNVAVEGTGTVWIKDVELLKTPLKPAGSERSPGAFRPQETDPFATLKPTGPPATIVAFDVKSHPETITEDVAQADEAAGAWQVETDVPRSIGLFDVEAPDAEAAMLTYRAKLRTEDVRGKAYLEMWVWLPGKGGFFSRGLDRTVSGTSDWTEYEIPFYLTAGQKPDRVRLGLTIDGRGTVWIKDVELLKTPLEPKPDAAPNPEQEVALNDLRRLVELKETNLQRTKARHAAQVIPDAELDAAEADLVEAQVRLAVAAHDSRRRVELHQRLLELAEKDLRRVKALSETGVVPASEVNEAEQRVIEARLRLKEAEAGTTKASRR